MWLKQKEMRLTYTQEITVDQLPSAATLQNTPGIFQTKLDKNFELRVTYLGAQAIAVKLRSQEHPKGLIDWRSVPATELKIEAFSLPKIIDEKCQLLMKRLGLVFGCFDLIVSPANEYYFLEINEQGQFLWVEEIDPTIKMLDAFVDFLVNTSKDFKWQPSKSSVSLQAFKAAMIQTQEKARLKHKEADLIF